MIRLGLCCTFRREPIKFRHTTAAVCARLSKHGSFQKLSEISEANASALSDALEFCVSSGIGCFRVMSQLLPLKTHPDFHYDLPELPAGASIRRGLRRCRQFARLHDLRLVFHPDQFVVLSSPHEEVVSSSIAEIEYQAETAELIGADVITVHAGGGYGDKKEALRRFQRNLNRVSERARRRLAVENDDRVYTPADLLPLAVSENLPLVYDVHHHRCNPDGISTEEATRASNATWNREPLLHISSPLNGWKGGSPHSHSDYINPGDFPEEWLRIDATVEVEAKAKERAVIRLANSLKRRGAEVWSKRSDGSN